MKDTSSRLMMWRQVCRLKPSVFTSDPSNTQTQRRSASGGSDRLSSLFYIQVYMNTRGSWSTSSQITASGPFNKTLEDDSSNTDTRTLQYSPVSPRSYSEKSLCPKSAGAQRRKFQSPVEKERKRETLCSSSSGWDRKVW